MKKSLKKTRKVLVVLLSLVLVLGHFSGMKTFATQAAAQEETLLFETSFETGLDGFVPRGAAILERTTERSNTGDYSVFVSNRTVNWNGASLPLSGIVRAGNTYRFTAYMAAELDVAQNYIMSGEFNAGISTGNQWPWLANRTLTVADGFVRFEATLEMPEDMTSFNLNFEHQAVGVNFFLDTVSVVRIAEGDNDNDLPENLRGAPATLAETPLHEIWADYFMIGNIYTPWFPNDLRGDVLAHHFNSITAENIMKPDHLQGVRNVFTFGPSNNMMDFAVRNDQEVIGHTLVWHSQSFPWFEALNPTRDEAIEMMQTHIRTVMGHFNERNPGLITGWDVLNEAIQPRQGVDPTNWRLHLRDTKWYRAIGYEYIEIAFRTAHEMDPDAILYYNDYNCNDFFKATIIRYMVEELRENGVPIHRIGMQGHYNIQTPITSVRTSVERFREIGGHYSLSPIGISFTEIDVTVPGFEDAARLPREVEIRQAQFYAQLMQILREHSDVIHRATFWGMSDRDSWRSDRHPNLLDRQYGPKLSFFAVADPDGFLYEFPIPEIPDALTAYAPEGRTEIGAFNRAAFDDAYFIRVANQMTAHNGATADVRVMWYDDAIYVLADIDDRTPNVEADAFHEQDSFEIFLSNFDSRISHYMPGDFQLRFGRNGVHSYGSTGSVEGMTFAVNDRGNQGYTVEVRIPLEGEVYVGRRLGFDLQVNDAWVVAGVPGRQAFANWNDHTDNGWQSTQYWGWLVLDGEPSEPVCEVRVNGRFAGADGSVWRICEDGRLEIDSGVINWTGALSPWDMHRAFITQIDITGPITAGPSLRALFRELREVTAINGLTYFNTTATTTMYRMFFGLSGVTALDVTSFDTRNVTSMALMFRDASSLVALDVSGFDTRNVTDMREMFRGTGIEQLDLSSFDTSNVTNMNQMFTALHTLRYLTLGESFSFIGTPNLVPIRQTESYTGLWQGAGVALTSAQLMARFDGSTMAGTFVWQPWQPTDPEVCEVVARGRFANSVAVAGAEWRLCDNGTLEVNEGFINWTLVTSPWHVHRADITEIVFTGPITAGTSLRSLFHDLPNVEVIEGLIYFDTRTVTNMGRMFRGASSLTEIDLSNFDTSNVTDMGWMFFGASGLESLDVTGFDTSNVVNMGLMFREASSLTELDVTDFDTSNVTDMREMFRGMSSLEALDLSSFDTRNVTNMNHMFVGMTSLRELILGASFTPIGSPGIPRLN